MEWLFDRLTALFQVCSESMRFEKLMEHFKNEDDNIDFLVCSHSILSLFTEVQSG